MLSWILTWHIHDCTCICNLMHGKPEYLRSVIACSNMCIWAITGLTITSLGTGLWLYSGTCDYFAYCTVVERGLHTPFPCQDSIISCLHTLPTGLMTLFLVIIPCPCSPAHPTYGSDDPVPCQDSIIPFLCTPLSWQAWCQDSINPCL